MSGDTPQAPPKPQQQPKQEKAPAPPAPKVGEAVWYREDTGLRGDHARDLHAIVAHVTGMTANLMVITRTGHPLPVYGVRHGSGNGCWRHKEPGE